MAAQSFSKQQILTMQATCMCLQARGKARVLTKEYDLALAPSGLKITQFSLLAVLLAGPSTITELAEAVAIDRTTLTRNLTPLAREGYITSDDGEDKRNRLIALTEQGTQRTLQALELGKQVQALHGIKQV